MLSKVVRVVLVDRVASQRTITQPLTSRQNGERSEDLIRIGTLTQELAEILKTAVVKRQNILISGGTGTGKTTHEASRPLPHRSSH